MDPKQPPLQSRGNRGTRGTWVGTLPSFCPAGWSWRTRRVRGLVLLLLLQTSVATDGKTDAAAPLLPVRAPPPKKNAPSIVLDPIGSHHLLTPAGERARGTTPDRYPDVTGMENSSRVV